MGVELKLKRVSASINIRVKNDESVFCYASRVALIC